MDIKNIPLSGGAFIRAYLPDHEVGYHFYKERPGILLAPGGAYLIHATREQEGVALEFMARGYNVFILYYSLGFSSREAKEASDLSALDTAYRYPLPVLEMMEAVHLLKTQADGLHLDASRLFLMGFSAGGHVCGSYSVFWHRPEFARRLSFCPEPDELKVSGIVLGYPLVNPGTGRRRILNDPANPEAKLVSEFIFQTPTPTQEQKDAVDLALQVTDKALPAFIWHSVDDPIVNAADSTRFVLAMQEHDVPCEYHLFERGGHGLCLANSTYAKTAEEVMPDIAVWPELAQRWMQRR